MLSIVGPYLSYSNTYYAEGGAHPTYGTNYITYNLETKKRISLSNIFSDEKLAEALSKNEFIKRYLYSEEIKNLDQLYGEFMKKADCDYSLDLTAFSFGEVKGNKVIILIGIPYGCEVSRGNFELIAIELDVPNKLKKLLKKADKMNLLDKEKKE